MIDFFKKNSEYFKIFLFGVALIVVFKTFDNLTSIFHSMGVVIDAAMPFVAAFIVAYMLNLPSVKLSGLLQKINSPFIKKHSMGISIFIVYIIAIVLVSVTVSALVPAIYENLVEMTKSLPQYMVALIEKFSDIEAIKNLNIDTSQISIDATMNSLLEAFDMDLVGSYVGRVFNMTSGVMSGFIAFVASIYMLLDKENIVAGLKKFIKLIFKEKKAQYILTHAKNINDIFTKFIYCRLICSAICGMVCVIVLSLMNVKYAIILGIFIGAMDMIPYFGSIISCVVAIFITFITGGVWQGIWVSVALLIIQQLDGNLLAPYLMGDSLELRPLWIVVAVAVGGNLFGFMGMLLSVPVLAVVRAIVGEYLDELVVKRNSINDTEDREDTK